MSYPFLIWTMQRTGGTALTDLLMNISEHERVEHEPFNWHREKPRQFWPVLKAWNDSGDVSALARSLGDIFARRYLIKHCYELHKMTFNAQLMDAAAKTPYRHIHLFRRDEASRLISKYIAEAQGTWFKPHAERRFSAILDGRGKLGPLPVDKVVAHYHHSQEQMQKIAALLRSTRVDSLDVYYEDIYDSGLDAGMARMEQVLTFLGFQPEDIERHRSAIADTLRNSGQNTRSVRDHVPNLRDVLEALTAAGCPASREYRLEDLPTTPPVVVAASGAQHRLATIFQELAAIYGAEGPVLEVGLRPGTPAVPWADPAIERHVLTADPSVVVEGATMHYGDATAMPDLFESGRFMAVVSNGALAHDRHLLRTLDEMKRVLAPGGLLMVAVPSFSKAANQAGVRVVGAKGNNIGHATVTHAVLEAPDYWRLSPQAMRQVVLADLDILEVREAMMPPRVFGVGRKPA